MTKYPGNCDRGLVNAILVSNLLHGVVHFLILGVVNKYAVDKAILEGRPRLNGDVLQTAVVQHAAVTIYGVEVVVIGCDGLYAHVGVSDTELHLVDLDRHRAVFL